MLRPVETSPCWVLTHELIDPPETGERHYVTETDAQRGLWRHRADVKRDLDPGEAFPTDLLTSLPVKSEDECHLLVCDFCGNRLHHENGDVTEGGTHFDPGEVDAILLADHDWSHDRQGRHHCRSCPVLEETFNV
jgi:hypothetical protein